MAVALMTDPNKIGIRKFLTGHGYKDDEIGYDPARKMVTLQGRDYTTATPGSDNYTYDTNQNLTGALNTFNQLKAREQRQGDINSLVTRLKERTAQPARTFAYDPSTDPSYQAALRTAQTNAQVGSNANLAEMNRRGILNSTITSDRGARIQQQELGRVTTEVLPQLHNQAYNRFVNEQNQEQSQFQNLANLVSTLSGLNQQEVDNQFRQGQADRNVFESDRNYTYQEARDAIADERYKAEFDRDVERWGLEFAQNKAIQNGQLAVSRQNAATSRQNADLSQTRYDDEQNANTLQSQVMDGISQFDNAKDASAWLNANAASITQNLGPDSFAELKEMLPLFFGEDTSAQDAKAQAEAARKLRQQAVEMAQKDLVAWDAAKDAAAKEALIQQYVKLLGG